MADPRASRRAKAVRARASLSGAPLGAPEGSGASPTRSATVTGPASRRWPATQAAAASSSSPERLGERPSLGGDPAPLGQSGPTLGGQLVEPGRPFLDGPGGHQREQQVVHLVGIPGAGLHLLEDQRDRVGIERSELAGRHRKPVGPELAEAAAQRQRPGPAFFERRVVEIGVGPSAQDCVREGRGLRRLDRVHGDLARLDPGPHLDQSLDREPFVQAVVDGLARQHVVGHADRARRRVLLAGGEAGPDRGEKVVGFHALKVDGAALASVHARQDERAGQVPAPARTEHRMQQHRLGQDLGRLGARQHGLHTGQREAVLGAEGEDDGVVVRRCLQLEVERHAEPLPQRQPERPVDAPTEGRVDDQLRALGVVEAPLDHDALVCGKVAERLESGRAVGDDLLGHLGRDPGPFAHEPTSARRRRRHAGAARARRRRSLTASESSAVRAGASPSQNGIVGGRSPASCTRTVPTSTLAHPPRVRPEQEDVPGRGLHREVLVHRANRHPVGIEDDAVVAGLGDGAAAGQCRQARAAARRAARPLTAS